MTGQNIEATRQWTPIQEARRRFVEMLAFGADVDIMDAQQDLIDAADDLKKWAAQEATNRIAAIDALAEDSDV